MHVLTERLELGIVRVKTDYNMVSLGIAVFTLYSLTQRLLDLYSNIRFYDITVIRIFELFLFSFSLLCLLIGGYELRKPYKIFTVLDVLWFFAIAFICISLFYINADRYYYFVFVSVFLFLYFAKTEIDNFSTAFLLIKYGAIFYAVGTLVQFVIPEHFNSFILNFTTKYSQEILDYRVALNYYPGFGFNQLSLAANYISIGLGLILVFWGGNRAKILKDIILLILLFVALFITGKRSFLLWTIASLTLTYIATGLESDRIRRIIKASAVVFGSAVLVFVVAQYFGNLPLFARLQLLFREIIYQDVTGSVAIRFSLYRDAWAVFLNNPWLGIGWDQFMVVHESGFRVHNLILQLLAETGVIGFLIIVPPIIYTYAATYKAMRTSVNRVDLINPLWSKALVFSFYYQTVFLLNCLSDTLFYRPPFLLMYFLTLAIVNSYLSFKRNTGFGKV